MQCVACALIDGGTRKEMEKKKKMMMMMIMTEKVKDLMSWYRTPQVNKVVRVVIRVSEYQSMEV